MKNSIMMKNRMSVTVLAFFGLQIHKGNKGKVLWRNLRVKELE